MLTFQQNYYYVNGEYTSPGYTASALITSNAGRLVGISVIVKGTGTSIFYNHLTAPTISAAGNGTTATIGFSGTYTFTIGDTVVVSGVIPTGYNGTYTVTGATANTVSFASTTTGAQTSPGTVFNPSSEKAIAAATTTDVGVYPVGSYFANGLYMVIGTGQKISVNYSLD